MQKYAFRSVLMIVVFGLIVARPSTATGNDFKIIPGERIGDVSLSMSIDDILRLLGRPSGVRHVTPSQAEYTWEGHRIRVYQSLDTGRVSDVRTYWRFRDQNPYRTDKGIGVAANIDELRRAYGDSGCFFSEHATSRRVWWPELGIFFFIWTSSDLPDAIQNKVGEIGVGRPRSTPPGSGNKSCSELG